MFFSFQTEIRNKLKALSEVVEMLSSLIRDNQSLDDLERQFASDSPSSSRSREKNHKSASSERYDETQRYDYQHYDPELHWCRTCDVFPKTAKDLLLHLQSEDHRKVAKERGMKDDTPWHNLPPEPQLPSYEGAQIKRLPIKGKTSVNNTMEAICFRLLSLEMYLTNTYLVLVNNL